MTLLAFLKTNLPDQELHEEVRDTYTSISCQDFTLNIELLGERLLIRYIKVTEPGKRFGDTVVSLLVSFCQEGGLTPYAIMPEEEYKHFWLRNGFEPTADDDEWWIHEDWV